MTIDSKKIPYLDNLVYLDVYQDFIAGLGLDASAVNKPFRLLVGITVVIASLKS